MHQLTTVETVHEEGSYLFTADDPHGNPEEVVLVPCEDGVSAWVNRCTHEDQRFDTGDGVPDPRPPSSEGDGRHATDPRERAWAVARTVDRGGERRSGTSRGGRGR